ncbi:hypothetical protein D3C72_1996040 [compost metagenome]
MFGTGADSSDASASFDLAIARRGYGLARPKNCSSDRNSDSGGRIGRSRSAFRKR